MTKFVIAGKMLATIFAVLREFARSGISLPMHFTRWALVLAMVLAACQKPQKSVRLAYEGSSSDSKAFVQGCLSSGNRRQAKVAARAIHDGPYVWKTAPYALSAESNHVSLSLAVNTQWASDVKDTAQARRQIVRIRECMIGFFRKHGIDLILFFNEVQSNPHVTVRWRAHSKEFNASHWALNLEDPFANEFEEVCSAITHEFSHLLGLKDEYEDNSCPDRILGESDSIMRNCWAPSSEIRFHPRHIETIVGPVCGLPTQGRSSL